MAVPPKLTRSQAEEFLFEEARLIDEREFTEWLQLFAEGGIYWIPIVEESDPTRETSILYDDDALRELRVTHMFHERNFAQMPPSRTVHQVTNVQVWHDEGEAEALIRCNLVVHEIRTGDHLQLGLGDQRVLASKCEYRLRYHEGQWRIALKKVVLINRHLPITNLSFLL